MKLDKYTDKVMDTVNYELPTEKKVMSFIFGIVGESGEVVDIFKKYFFHSHRLDLEKVKEEIGDLMWYVVNLCNEYKLDLEEIFFLNIKKLKARYPNGFESVKSEERYLRKENKKNEKR